MTPLARRLGVLLAVSVALNLLLVGFLVGRGLHRHRGHGGAARREATSVWRHPALKRQFDKHDAQVLAQRTATRRAQEAVRTALVSQPFVPGELEARLAALRQETATSQELMHRALLAAATNGTPQARQELARGFGRDRKAAR